MSKTGFSPLDQLEKKFIIMNTSKFLCSFESCQVPQAISGRGTLSVSPEKFFDIVSF